MNDETQALSRARWKLPLLIALAAGALAVVAFLGCTTVYSSDDYWYSTFMDHGVSYYFHMMWVHYQTINGRSLVHFFAQLILHVGNVLFMVFLVGCCIVIPMALYATVEGKKPLESKLLCQLLFTAGILLLPRTVMVNGVLWISAFCNYFLSTAMVAAETYLLYRTMHQEKIGIAGKVLLLAFCFCCGATTEQMGAAAVCVALLYALQCLFQKKKGLWLYIAATGCALIGLATVFLSPATSKRASRETAQGMTAAGGFFSHLKNQLRVQADYFSGSWFLLAVFGGLFLFTAWLLWQSMNARPAATIWCVLGAASLILLRITGWHWIWFFYLAVIGLTALQTLLWMRAGYCGPAFFLLAGLGSAGIILITNTSGERTVLPLCLCMLADLSWVGTMLLEKLPGKALYSGVAIAVSILAFVNIGRQIPGYWHNYQVEQENLRYEAEAADTGVLYYNTGYDRSYTHIKPYDDGYFFNKWKESAGADTEGYQIYFYREDLPNVYAGGVRTESPAIQGSSGWLLPLTGVANALGGSLESANSDWSAYTIRLQDQVYAFSTLSQDKVSVEWTDDTGTHQMEGEKSQGYYATCVSLDIFTQAFGLEVQQGDGEIRLEFPADSQN